ncbi:MAG: T9SS type A sorting domain-containing protein [Bacteroidales bacterium]|nr:T9SS type A sorting domain-containing protein [Bacteroidales bacterium]
MAKRILTLAFAALISLLASMAREVLPSEVIKKGNPDDPQIERAPMRNPIVAAYEETDATITIQCNVDAEGDVTMYNSNGAIVFYSSEIDCTLDVSGLPTGAYTIVAETDSWIVVTYFSN